MVEWMFHGKATEGVGIGEEEDGRVRVEEEEKCCP